MRSPGTIADTTITNWATTSKRLEDYEPSDQTWRPSTRWRLQNRAWLLCTADDKDFAIPKPPSNRQPTACEVTNYESVGELSVHLAAALAADGKFDKAVGLAGKSQSKCHPVN